MYVIHSTTRKKYALSMSLAQDAENRISAALESLGATPAPLSGGIQIEADW